MSPWRPGGVSSWCGSCRPGNIAARAGSSGSPAAKGVGRGHALRTAAGVGVLAATGMAVPIMSSGYVPRQRGNEFGSESRRITDCLLVMNGVIFITNLAMGGDKLLAMGAKVNSAIVAGQWWRLFTAAALHANFIHLAVNCFSLNAIGPMVENLSGHERYLSVYMTAAFTGNLASFAFSSNPAVGASGAIFGLGGALALFAYRHKEFLGKKSDLILQQLSMTLAFNLLFGLVVRNIDNWGHMGGLVGGAAAAWLLGPKLTLERQLGGKKPRVVDNPPLHIFARRPVG